MFRPGATHILECTDHLLFLHILLISTPLRAVEKRRGGLTDVRTTLGRISRTTLVFTVGHSMALALSDFGHFDIPAQPVEVFMDLRILVGDAHAIRPLFPGREAAVGGLFGLGHGMAFSLSLAEMNLSATRLALSLGGFNPGIERMQLLLVLPTLPTLICVTRLHGHAAARTACAEPTAVAALGRLHQAVQNERQACLGRRVVIDRWPAGR
ncbi:HupE/UreJ family protein [Streptomyces sp. SID12501]|uniref:HupE/UreJ family protein n=1 Tax=Streptomyces sp. SID12501 TaxID=2706042 RepID=A0A6B3BW82_9ACTN|nr:HupE/UreJ family protein [Streptomyces sp. SID12501]